MFPKFHGIRLAGASWIENLSLESLDTDPAVTSAGRMWHNTTSGTINYSVLNPDQSGTFLILSIHDKASADAALATLQGNINVVQANLDAEAYARDQAIAVAAATASDQLATETNQRLQDEYNLGNTISGVQSELDRTQTSAGLNSDGSYTAPSGSSRLGDTRSLAEAISTLDFDLTREASDRDTADQSLTAAIAAEAQARVDGDAALTTQLQAFVSAAVGSNAIADQAEAVARIAADTAIQAELDHTQASLGLTTDGSYVAPTDATYIAGATTLANATVLLDAELARVETAAAAEVSTRTTAVATVTAAVVAETTARTTADTAILAEVKRIEIGAGLEADGTYAAPTGSNYLGASTSLKDASFKLDAALKSVSTTVAGLSQGTADEAARALAAETALGDQITVVNGVISDFKASVAADKFVYKETIPALTRDIQHNLNCEYLEFTVMVQGDDGRWYNDICNIIENGLNSISIDLAESRCVKVVITRQVQLG